MCKIKGVGLVLVLGLVCYVPPTAGLFNPVALFAPVFQVVTQTADAVLDMGVGVVIGLADIANALVGTSVNLLGSILGQAGSQILNFKKAIDNLNANITRAGNGYENFKTWTNGMEKAMSDIVNEMKNLTTTTFGNTATKIKAADTFMKSVQAAISNITATIAAQKNQASNGIAGIGPLNALLEDLQDALDMATGLLATIVEGIAATLSGLLLNNLNTLSTNLNPVTANNWKQWFTNGYGTFTNAGQIYLNASAVRFWLYPTSDDPTNAVEIVLNDTLGLSSSGYISGNPLILIIPGVTMNYFDAASILRNAFWDPNNVNLVVVDWKNVAGSAITVNSLASYIAAYTQLAYSVDFTAQVVNQFLQFVYTTEDYIYSYLPFTDDSNKYVNVHIVCHSLGVHVGGRAADYFQKNITGIQVNRISGADPAGPYFQDRTAGNLNIANPYSSWRFNSAQARYTQALITNAGGFGFVTTNNQQIAGADIYINGGSWQPSCVTALTDALKTVDLKAQCSHNYAALVLAWSTNTTFATKGCKAGNCSPDPTSVGARINLTASGMFNANITLPTQ